MSDVLSPEMSGSVNCCHRQSAWHLNKNYCAFCPINHHLSKDAAIRCSWWCMCQTKQSPTHFLSLHWIMKTASIHRSTVRSICLVMTWHFCLHWIIILVLKYWHWTFINIPAIQTAEHSTQMYCWWYLISYRAPLTLIIKQLCLNIRVEFHTIKDTFKRECWFILLRLFCLWYVTINRK